MRVYSIVCYGRVMCSFFSLEDAMDAQSLIKRITGLDCMFVEDKPNATDYMWKDDTAVALLNFLDSLTEL